MTLPRKWFGPTAADSTRGSQRDWNMLHGVPHIWINIYGDSARCYICPLVFFGNKKLREKDGLASEYEQLIVPLGCSLTFYAVLRGCRPKSRNENNNTARTTKHRLTFTLWSGGTSGILLIWALHVIQLIVHWVQFAIAVFIKRLARSMLTGSVKI